MSRENLSVIIVTYNSSKYIKKCLNSIFKSDDTLKKEIIIVDNNSQDNTVKILNSFRKKIKLIKESNNVGFSKAINSGIATSKYPYILLINPDTILSDSSISKLIKEKEKHGVEICGGKMIKNDGSIHGTYVRKPNLLIGVFDFSNLRKIFPNNKWHKYFYYQDMGNIMESFRVDAVSGGFMLIEKKIIKSIGPFDEHFFMYLEDIDFCIRAKEHGYSIMYCPSSIIWHEGGGSSNNTDKINYSAWINSRSYYFKKHIKFYENIILQILFTVDRCVIGLIRKIKKKQ
jgi:GT2 family glycosyltransferase